MQSSAKTEVTKFQLKGNSATAIYQANEPGDPCLETFVLVAVSDLIEKVSPGDDTPDLRAVLTVIQRDPCTDTIIFNGQGDTANPNVHIAPNLKSATLTATVPMLDVISGLIYTFTIDLEWDATGKH